MAFREKLITESRVPINYSCERCCQPLKIHSSFRDIGLKTLSELASSQSTNVDKMRIFEAFQNKSDESNVMRKVVLPVKLIEASSDFMFIDDLSNLPLDDNETLRIIAVISDIMSDKSALDHPVCDDCIDILQDHMDLSLKSAEEDCKEYREFLKRLESENKEDDLEKLKLELAALQKEESDLEAELELVEDKEKKVTEAVKAAEDEWKDLLKEKNQRWHDYCRIKRKALLSEDSHRSVDNQLKYAQIQLDKLNKTNVFNATFHIWHNGHFGTINNFRLGRLRTVPVEWPEINAAWGQTVLLLHTLAKKLNLTFERYRLVPCGNHSYIETLENKSLPLYCFGGIRFMLDHKFDLAMVAFLDCLQQFKEKVESGDGSFHLPYAMDKGKIIDKSSNSSYSIKIQFNSEEQWTKALKFMLTNLKWALAFVSAQFQDSYQSHN